MLEHTLSSSVWLLGTEQGRKHIYTHEYDVWRRNRDKIVVFRNVLDPRICPGKMLKLRGLSFVHRIRKYQSGVDEGKEEKEEEEKKEGRSFDTQFL